ncbi:MAG: hydrolase [Alphaproteobacteria bacterium]|nr:MAG: hydrolase [Alphaproteobacteria bacterium]
MGRVTGAQPGAPLEVMSRIRGVIFDLDGVLHVRDAALPGAAEAIARLRRAGVPMRFVTNTTRRPRRAILEALDGMGLAVAPEELLTPAAAVCLRLKERRERARLLIHPALAEDFQDVEQGGDAVVLGDAGDEFRYSALNAAFRLLIGGAPLYALAANRYFKDADGLSLDCGAFVAALEYASGAKAELFGKPAPAFFQSALDGLGCAAQEAVMVGDDVEADVNGALALGIRAMLVRTGKYRESDEARLAPGGMVVDHAGDAVDRILHEL